MRYVAITFAVWLAYAVVAALGCFLVTKDVPTSFVIGAGFGAIPIWPRSVALRANERKTDR